MPRKARIDAPGALHHIIVRGIERKAIFKDSLDYKNIINRLEIVLSETKTPCFAWALMGNHFHLLLRTGVVSISTVMRRLLTGYAQQFNRRHQRHGQLFQNRFKSILCEHDLYLLELVRYIHLNPLRGKIVKDLKSLKTYPYCGHGVIMGKLQNDFQDVNYVLKMFSHKVAYARRSYAAFVAKGISLSQRPDFAGGGLIRSAGGWSALKALRSKSMRIMGDERILGSSEFVESVLKLANENYERNTLAMIKGVNLVSIIRKVSNHFDIKPKLIMSNSKQSKICRARAIVCFLAAEKLGITGSQIAQKLNISPSTVSKALVNGRKDHLSGSLWIDIIDGK